MSTRPQRRQPGAPGRATAARANGWMTAFAARSRADEAAWHRGAAPYPAWPAPALQATRAPPGGSDRAPPVPSQSDPVERRTPVWAARWPGLLAAALVNGAAVLAFAYLWQHAVHDLSAPEAIPVELVSSVPGESDAAPPPPAPPPPPAQEKPPAPPAAAAPAPLDPLKEALAMPSSPAPAAPTAPPAPAPPAGDPAARSSLAEPPPEPKAAATQAERNAVANRVEPAGPPAPAPAAAPPAAPDVLTAARADTAVPAPAPEPDHPAADAPADPAATVPPPDMQMAAALPLASLGMPASFRAMLSAQGTSASAEYKGAVYGALRRAANAMAGEAEQKHLRGSVAVSVVVGDTGAIVTAAVIQSSGSAPTDALALETVRRAAPFPPPPPGTTRSFNPVIQVGDPEP